MQVECSFSSRARDLLTGKCRFCLKSGTHRSLNIEYYCYGMREVYTDILMECYGVSLSTDCPASQLICLSCVERLRDAYTFRELVLKAEQRLLDPLHDDEAQFVHVGEGAVEVKTEFKTEKFDDDDDDDVDCSEELTTKYEPEPKVRTSNLVPGEVELIQRYDLSNVKLPSLPDAFRRHLNELRGKITCAKDVAKILEDTEKEREEKTTITEKRAILHNVITIIKYSNVTPFKSKMTKGFPCLYCRKPKPDLSSLKHHVTAEHENDALSSVLWRYSSESLVVYVDVTDLACNICDQSIPNIATLKTHLASKHSKKIYSKHQDRIIPFKLSDSTYHCAICDSDYQTFGSLERHMNIHYRNYTCTECGSGFVTKYRLKVHRKCHSRGSFTCTICSKVFKTPQKVKFHIDSVHKCVKRFKCPQCNERFNEYFARRKHQVEKHGAEPLKYSCKVCDRTFGRRFCLSRHLKKDHLEERNHQCEYCPYRCFTITELKVHLVKHIGDRSYECEVCKKSYARKKTLTEHMRIHNNDRRYACTVCGQAFIQKCSLKGHMKTHHPEVIVNWQDV